MAGQSERDLRAYQLHELEIARDPNHPAFHMPPIRPEDRSVLDLGCGAGQLLMAAGAETGRFAVGMDIDLASLKLGKSLDPSLALVRARGEALPFRDGAFDLVVSRVALPYMDIPAAAREVSRVLREGGGLWCSLHPLRLTMQEVAADLRGGHLKGLLFRGFVVCNGLLLHLFGRQIRLRARQGRTESFQTRGAMRRILRRAGFAPGSIRIESNRFFTARAVKPGPGA